MIKSSDYQLWLDHYITTSAGGLTIISGKGMVRRKTGRNHGFFVVKPLNGCAETCFFVGQTSQWVVPESRFGRCLIDLCVMQSWAPRSNYQNSLQGQITKILETILIHISNFDHKVHPCTAKVNWLVKHRLILVRSISSESSKHDVENLFATLQNPKIWTYEE